MKDLISAVLTENCLPGFTAPLILLTNISSNRSIQEAGNAFTLAISSSPVSTGCCLVRAVWRPPPRRHPRQSALYSFSGWGLGQPALCGSWTSATLSQCSQHLCFFSITDVEWLMGRLQLAHFSSDKANTSFFGHSQNLGDSVHGLRQFSQTFSIIGASQHIVSGEVIAGCRSVDNARGIYEHHQYSSTRLCAPRANK